MIFYTADLHFHYEPFLPSRPFDTVENMDRQLIHRWNEAVSEEDTVYVVGDVGYNRGLVPGDALSRLRGHKHLIRGNHDTGFEDAREIEHRLSIRLMGSHDFREAVDAFRNKREPHFIGK